MEGDFNEGSSILLSSRSVTRYDLSHDMTSSGVFDPERRRYPRVKIHVPIELNYAGSPPVRTATDEVSLCGCYIETIFTLDVGIRLAVCLSLGDAVVKCMAVVATKYPQVGNGIDFIDMMPDDRLQLNDYIARQDKV